MTRNKSFRMKAVVVGVAMTVLLGAGAASASNGADDPAGHVRHSGEDNAVGTVQRQGEDNAVGTVQRQGDVPAGHVRHSGDGVGHR